MDPNGLIWWVRVGDAGLGLDHPYCELALELTAGLAQWLNDSL